MFHQIMHYLAMKEEMSAAQRGEHPTNSNGLYNTANFFLPEEEIQKVIFDKQYIRYLERKLHGEEMGLPGLYWNMGGPKEKEKKAQLLQYESIKTELKQEYEKKSTLLKSRLTQRAQKDPSFWIFNQMANEAENKSQLFN